MVSTRAWQASSAFVGAGVAAPPDSSPPQDGSARAAARATEETRRGDIGDLSPGSINRLAETERMLRARIDAPACMPVLLVRGGPSARRPREPVSGHDMCTIDSGYEVYSPEECR